MDHSLFIGREQEQAILHKALASPEAEMLAIVGRRRVGKTFLIKSVYGDRIAFQMSGIQHASMDRQLENFSYRLSLLKEEEEVVKTPSNWFRAFTMLIDYLRTKKSKEKYVVFFDELPWMASHKSDFISSLSFFWNSWAVDQQIVVVICGSAASWMVQKVVNHTGGLHNRITKRINLKPFTLYETELYFQRRNIPLTRYQIVQIYMALGGIPHYLKEVEAGKSAIQNINDICFSDAALLKDEFSNLYPALFQHAERHVAIIRALATKRMGIRRAEIISASKIPNGGTLSKTLEELELSGFITSYFSHGKKKKDKLYRLTDEYSLFYLSFIEKNIYQGPDTWQQLSQTQSYKSWSGYTFEGICIKHLAQLKKALSIGGVYAIASSFFHKGSDTEKGAQIDLLLDRNDQVVTLFEMKFYQETFIFNKSNAEALRHKQQVFQQVSQSKKLLLWTLIAPFGIKHTPHSLDLIYHVLTLDDLFVEA